MNIFKPYYFIQIFIVVVVFLKILPNCYNDLTGIFFFFSFMKEKFIFPSCTPTKETSTANLLGRVQIQMNHKPGVLDLFGNLIRTCFFFFFHLGS
jgi:hypothetical protein